MASLTEKGMLNVYKVNPHLLSQKCIIIEHVWNIMYHVYNLGNAGVQ